MLRLNLIPFTSSNFGRYKNLVLNDIFYIYDVNIYYLSKKQ